MIRNIIIKAHYVTEEDLQDYNLTTLNHDLETCYRYLDFIEDFLERYDESTNGKFMDNTDYDSWIAALRGNLHQIIRGNKIYTEPSGWCGHM